MHVQISSSTLFSSDCRPRVSSKETAQAKALDFIVGLYFVQRVMHLIKNTDKLNSEWRHSGRELKLPTS